MPRSAGNRLNSTLDFSMGNAWWIFRGRTELAGVLRWAGQAKPGQFISVQYSVYYAYSGLEINDVAFAS